MKFWEAMRALEEGKKVRVVSWPIKEYVYVGEENCLFCEDGSDWSIEINDAFDCNEWELYEEPEQPQCHYCGNTDCGNMLRRQKSKLLTFAEMVQGLKEGKRFKRKGWNSDIYLNVRTDSLRVVLENNSYRTLLIEDFEATDWVEIS